MAAKAKRGQEIQSSYFIIPAIILALSWLDGWFAWRNLDWIQQLTFSSLD